MTVTTEQEQEIKRLFHAENWRLGTIASQLGIHLDVVRRALGLLDLERKSQPQKVRLIDPYVEFIDETLASYPRLRATRLYDMLKPRGYAGSIRTLRSHVAKVRPRPKHEAYLRVEPLVGEQAQVDWAYVSKVKVPGGERALWLFVMTLSWSRATWGEFVFDTTVYSLLRSLVRAAGYFGGTTRQWLFDNAKTVVVERHGDAVRFHPLLLDLAGQYHVQLRVCAVRKANQKGRVERFLRYLRDRFLAGRHITTIDQGNRELLQFLDEIAHNRPHPTLEQRTVRDCLAEEQKHLLPLPQPPPSTDLVQPVAVDKTACVRFDRNFYSVPPDYAQQTLALVADDQTVRLLDGGNAVAQHARCFGKKQLIESPQHRALLCRRKTGASESRGRDRLRTAIPGIDPLFARWVEGGRNVGCLTSLTIKLLDLYGSEMLEQAVTEALSRGTSDPGALAQLCEQQRRARHQPVPIDIKLGDHVPDCDVIPHNLEVYDAIKQRD